MVGTMGKGGDGEASSRKARYHKCPSRLFIWTAFSELVFPGLPLTYVWWGGFVPFSIVPWSHGIRSLFTEVNGSFAKFE